MWLTSCRPLLGRGALLALAPAYTRRAAYSTTPLAVRLHDELTTRKLPLTYDYLHPQSSHLLNLTLADLLAPQSQPSESQTQAQTPPALPSIKHPSPLPIAHHLIYFPPQVSLSQLLPDGTDILHTPGDPFNRRLWAGGNIRFPGPDPLLDGSRAVCIESIRNVTVKGREGEEKVIVTIERRVGAVAEGESEGDTWRRIWMDDESVSGESSLIENRDLIFMRVKSSEEIKADRESFGKTRIVKCEYSACINPAQPNPLLGNGNENTNINGVGSGSEARASKKKEKTNETQHHLMQHSAIQSSQQKPSSSDSRP